MRHPFSERRHAVHGLENIPVLHAHAQFVLFPLHHQFTAQTAQIHILGHHDLKDEQGVIGPALAENGLETFNIDAVLGKDTAHGRYLPGMIRAVSRDHKGLADKARAPLTFHRRTHQHGQILPGGFQTGQQLPPQFFLIQGIRGLNNEDGGKFAGKDGLRHLHDIAAALAENLADRGHGAGAVASQKGNTQFFHLRLALWYVQGLHYGVSRQERQAVCRLAGAAGGRPVGAGS